MIDTSTASEKDKKRASLYLARSEGEIIQYPDAVGQWFNLSIHAEISYLFRIKPQTVEEATQISANEMLVKSSRARVFYKKGFKIGAQWREENPKDQDND